MKVVQVGFILSIVGSLLVGVAPSGALAAPALMLGRICQGLSGACIMPASLALVKATVVGRQDNLANPRRPSSRSARTS